MSVHQVLPFPLRRMFEYLELDIERSFQVMPEQMKTAMQACGACEKFQMCDYEPESRYFRCPNRDLLDQLEDMEVFH